WSCAQKIARPAGRSRPARPRARPPPPPPPRVLSELSPCTSREALSELPKSSACTPDQGRDRSGRKSKQVFRAEPTDRSRRQPLSQYGLPHHIGDGDAIDRRSAAPAAIVEPGRFRNEQVAASQCSHRR